jgi:hypothetical protein
MFAPADAPPLNQDRADEPNWRETVAPSRRDCRDAFAFDKPRIGRDGIPPYNHRGTMLVAGAWLALYGVAVIQNFISSGN